ncbi:MAG: hypothetical protein OIN66_14310 [Candidatus Methanoperedens sp.]|nr:hypothetical protein [Candidatus Methanoperedens sp.]
MTLEARIIPEPELFFGERKTTIDPKVGLMNFGPSGLSSSSDSTSISVGVISTMESLELLRDWLERLKWRIEGRDIADSNVRGIDFPGISKDSQLRFEIEIDESNIEIITQEELNRAISPPNRKERILRAVELYKRKFSDIAGNHPLPRIVLLPLSDKLMNSCKDSKYKIDKIVYERRTFDSSKNLFDTPVFDFHNVMKVIAFTHNMVTQIIRPRTLKFSSDTQDPATIAWNFAVATYYKGTGFPWKLADIDSKTCYVGISFYQEISEECMSMRTSMAQIFLRTGESQVIRGKPFSWDLSQGLTPTLTSEQASEIMEDVLSLFKRQQGQLPNRVVVHKSSPFTTEEINGLNETNSEIELVDYLHIIDNVGVRIYPSGYDYPAIRGTFFGDKSKWFLFTTGFIPSLGTYPGGTVPMPIAVQQYRMSTTPYLISKDILALSKLDWNSADFCKRLPTTLSVSEKVGNILSEMRDRDVKDPPSGYRYYM